MNDDANATSDTNSDAEPAASETVTSIVESPLQEPETKKPGRAARSARAPKPAKSARTRKFGKSEEPVVADREAAVETVAKPAKKTRLAKAAKTAKASDANSDAEPAASETLTSIVESSLQEPVTKKAGRAARSAKAPKTARSTRTRKFGKSEEPVVADREAAVDTVAKPAKKTRPAKAAKTAKASETNSDAEPTASETLTSIVESPVQEPAPKKAGRASMSAKAPKPAKSARTRKVGKSEEPVVAIREAAVDTVAKPAKKTRIAKAAKTAKSVELAKGDRSAGRSKQPKPEKTIEAATAVKSTKNAKSAVKRAKANPATASTQTSKNLTGEISKGFRYSTNELNSAAKKAGLTVEFTPVVTKAAHIARGPAKEFKVDAIIARLLGSNGELIRDRGPGTPLYNDAESLAAVAIFEKFRGRTFHNKLKVEIL